nr:MAG TPA: hypothetical protein [Caudoviricetes sp.]
MRKLFFKHYLYSIYDQTIFTTKIQINMRILHYLRKGNFLK